MVFGDSLPGSANPLPLLAPRAPAQAAPVKNFPMSDLRHSAAPVPHSSASFAPDISASAAHSPAEHGLLCPPAPSLSTPHPSALSAPLSASLSDFPVSALCSSAVPATATRDWGAVLAPPPPAPRPAPVSGLVLSLDLVSIPPGGGGLSAQCSSGRRCYSR